MKIKAISVALSLMFLVLAAGLFYTQIVRYAKYANLSRNNRVRLIPIEGQRGRIFDRNGMLLVSNRSSFDIVVIPQELEDSSRTLARLASIVGMSAQQVYKKVEKNFTAPFAPITIKADADKKTAIMVEDEAGRLPGVMVRVIPKREYKFNEEGSHIFGYLGEIGRDELERLKGYGYQIRDLVGKSGLEKTYDSYLKGEGGGMQLEVNNRGYFVKALGRKESSCGRDLYLTIDGRLQDFIEKLLDGKTAACAVMAPDTGEILALVSKPDFDPDIFISREKDAQRLAILKSPEKPMLNRVTSGLYPPGSVFKPVVAIAALEKKKITSYTTFNCSGSYSLGKAVFNCWDEEGHGSETISEGLKNSCNVFFYQVGRQAGADDIYNYALKLGFGIPTGIDLPEEAAGLVPNKMWKRLVRKEGWFEGDTVNFSIGQGYVLVTPLQILRMTAAIANGGMLVRPHLVQKIENVEVASAGSRDIGISRKTIEIIKMGLRRVVEDETGTGRRARVEGVSIAGKTGTAQNPNGLSHAWFTGFAPVDKPKVALVVFVEHGGKGGLEAAESAGKIFAEAKNLGIL
jgi:penicillin-binding protein 2